MNPDVIVIGGSFAGLSAAMQLGSVRRNTLIVDASQPRNHFATVSHGFPGQDGRSPAEIKRLAEAEVLAYPSVALKKTGPKRLIPSKMALKCDLPLGKLFLRARSSLPWV
ncbi:FAD-binding protein [Candidatus Sodalis endolongispinus]|uniref:FAD-binding protein n=1 Tax=Candidatus Sodalis endolongispinus TaxID=2812662 RepID=A0ABS5YED6_9GAMM|nr:FAD-binding protein [Candidatus Sodalis endolongispinus]MBT9433419.1 FAD-binding protein [Candidatus Sodalis endolongispinus]